jgi:hypothetical protein
MLQRIPQKLLVAPPKTPLQQHSAHNTQPSHDKHQDESHQIPRLVRRDEEVRSHHIPRLAQDVIDSDGSGFLFWALAQRAGNLRLDQRVGAEEADDVDVRDDVARYAVLRCYADDVADHGAGDGDGKVPAAVLQAVGTPDDAHGGKGSAEVRRERYHQGDDARVAEVAHDCWVEV